MTPDHLLLAIIKDKDGQANKMLRSLGCDLAEMKIMIEDLNHSSKNNRNIASPQFSQKTDKIIRITFDEAGKSNRKIANQIDFLLSITKIESGTLKDVLSFYSIDYSKRNILTILKVVKFLQITKKIYI